MAGARFRDPLLLTAKMFLADIPTPPPYKPGKRECHHFAKEVIDAATQRKVRCGYVTLSFPSSPGHAVVAFKTDYGLVYFEPQNGDQETIQIGRSYGCAVDGVARDCVVESITIEWNDGTEDKFSI